MKKVHPLLLSVLSGLLLWAAWPVSPLTFIIFIAFIPLLWLEQQGSRRFFGAVFMSMLIWNIGTTWWVCNASLPGGIAAMLFSSLIMSIPWVCFRWVKKTLGQRWGYISLIVFWLTFEYIYLNIQLSWPWLTLGNVFAEYPSWVQWYEYTGSSGGSCWILVVNLLLFLLWKARKTGSSYKKHLSIALCCALLMPLIISLFINEGKVRMRKPRANADDKNVVVIQPNIDPYEKFNASAQHQQLQQLISLSDTEIDSATALVVWPETALSGVNGFNEEKIKEYPSLVPLWNFLARHPQITLYTGIEGFRIYDGEHKTTTAIKVSDADQYYDVFNSATLLNSKNNVPVFYHKSKLVPGVETLPTYLKIFDKWFEQFGGTAGGYAPQKERTVLTDSSSGYKIAPAICYESVYGEFLTAYIRNGANVIGIITNDGWWQNTAGYRQHAQYARLRAIETRRWVIRSANTGISCFIDPYGDVIQPQPYNTEAAIKLYVPMETRLTAFVVHGDILSKFAFVLSGLLLLITFIVLLRKRSHGKNNSF